MDPVMLTQLTTDLCRVLKHDLARFDNDASACYDRILVALGMLAARRCGMPENAIRTHAEALEFMTYTVKTVYGVSEDHYQGTAFEPLFGTGQGSGASPSVWLTLVVIMLNTLDPLVPDRITFLPLTGSRPHQRLVDAFVDDILHLDGLHVNRRTQLSAIDRQTPTRCTNLGTLASSIWW
jgi:hypothetical protein